MLLQQVAIPLCTSTPPFMLSHARVLSCGTPCKAGPFVSATTSCEGSASLLLTVAGFSQPGSIQRVNLRSPISWDNTSARATALAFTGATFLHMHAGTQQGALHGGVYDYVTIILYNRISHWADRPKKGYKR